MIPFVGFAPDAQPETQGIFTDCSNILPGISSFSAAPSKVDSGLGALDSTCAGFAITRNLANTLRTFAGSAAKLYEVSTVWTDKSKVGGYTLGPDDRWRFAQFGNVTLAATKSSTLQSISSGSLFADVSGTAPKAAIVETLNNQVFALNINGMGFGDSPERWACSAIGNETDWTPASATGCVSGQLLDAPGPITAGRRLGDIMVMYKDRAMWIAEFVGAPLIWNVRKLPGEIGTPCQEAVVTTGTAHYFVGNDDFYVFDGSRSQPLNSPLRFWAYSQLDQKYMYKIIGSYDRINKRIFWWFPSIGSNGVVDKCVVYNTVTHQWGRMDGAIEAAAEYVTPGVTFESLGTLYSTYDSLPTTVSYDSPFWNAAGSIMGSFGTDHKAYTYTGTPAQSKITTWHYGDNIYFSTVTRIKPRFIVSPISSQLVYYHSETDATNFTQGATSTFANQWYDLLWSARWHKFEMQFTGAMTISGIDVLSTQDGTQ